MHQIHYVAKKQYYETELKFGIRKKNVDLTNNVGVVYVSSTSQDNMSQSETNLEDKDKDAPNDET